MFLKVSAIPADLERASRPRHPSHMLPLAYVTIFEISATVRNVGIFEKSSTARLHAVVAAVVVVVLLNLRWRFGRRGRRSSGGVRRPPR